MKVTAILLAALVMTRGVYAVEISSAGAFQLTTPSTPGAEYVGYLNGASGTYIGNGYVLTAAHVGAGDFVLDNVTYHAVAGSARTLTTTGAVVNGTPYPTANADLTLFQITGNSLPGLTPLALSLTPPTPFINGANDGSSVVMIGFGGGHGETYGIDHVTDINQTVAIPDNQTPPTYISYDFITEDGMFTGQTTYTNNAQLIGGDSGGGAFIVDAAGTLELAGINEVLYQDNFGNLVASGMVQLSDGYAAQIDAITGLPEPPTWLLTGCGLGLLLCWSRVRRISAR